MVGAMLTGAYILWWPDALPVEPDSVAYPVRGVDISSHNGTVDFAQLAEGGYRFVMLKASEGMDFKDRAFVDNYRKAREAGLKVGAYHFFRFDRGGYEQALNLLHSVRGRKLDLPLAIDVEEWANPRDHTTRDILTRLQVMLTTLERHGYTVMLYSNKAGFDRFIYDRFAHYPLWLCSFTEAPSASQLCFWQFTHSGKVPGVEGKVDVNTYAGSEADWLLWLESVSHGKP